MFSITVALGNAQWRLLFQTEENFNIAEMALNNRMGGPCRITDDFSQVVNIQNSALLGGWISEDMNKSKMAHVELALHAARTQAAANKAAQADSGLRANAMMNGPGVLSPMNNFRPS